MTFLANAAQPMDESHYSAHAVLTDTLGPDFAEVVVGQRVAADRLVMQLSASDLMGRSTTAHRGNDGLFCVVSSGTGWRSDSQADEVFSTIALGA